MRRLVWGSLLLLTLTTTAWGQIPVMEDGPMVFMHTATAVQQTLNTVEAIFQSTQWVLELTSFGGHGSGIDNDWLLDVLSHSQRVLWDLNTLDQAIREWFALEGAPDNTRDLEERLRLIRHYRAEQQTGARFAQTLPRQAKQTLADLRTLWERILDITGNKQGQQQIQEFLVQLNMTAARTETSLGAFQQALLTEAAEQTLIDESIARMNTQLFATMPRRTPR